MVGKIDLHGEKIPEYLSSIGGGCHKAYLKFQLAPTLLKDNSSGTLR